MLSRVAETMYWLGREVERAENAARIVAVNANLLLDLPKGKPLNRCRWWLTPGGVTCRRRQRRASRVH